MQQITTAYDRAVREAQERGATSEAIAVCAAAERDVADLRAGGHGDIADWLAAEIAYWAPVAGIR